MFQSRFKLLIFFCLVSVSVVSVFGRARLLVSKNDAGFVPATSLSVRSTNPISKFRAGSFSAAQSVSSTSDSSTGDFRSKKKTSFPSSEKLSDRSFWDLFTRGNYSQQEVNPIQLIAQKDEIAPIFLRVFPVGNPPPFVSKPLPNAKAQKLVKKTRDLPPSSVTIAAFPGSEETLPLELNTITNQVEIKLSLPFVRLFEGEKIEVKIWKEIEVKKGLSSLLVLSPQRKEPKVSWEHIDALVVPDDEDKFPVGNLRLVNVSDQEIAVRFNEEKKAFPVKPKTFSVKEVPSNSFTFAVAKKGQENGYRPILSKRLEIEKGMRMTVVFYDGGHRPLTERVFYKFFSEKVPLNERPADE
ncbi:hypothetical protein N9F36_04625 [Akkermansiaceae bacterium]|nr:hypothetical protein [Akkermansiaceae bacterium]